MTYIYESPDGGDTVYRRKFGQIDRELHYQSPGKQELEKSYHRFMKWQKILQATKTNPALSDAVEKAEMIYNLTESND
jgi:hypothetical protein